MDKLRAEFEKNHCGNNPSVIRKNTTTGDYVLPSIQDAWAGYQACAESLRAELASERAANARLQELHTGLMKNADSMNDELRAANAKLRKALMGELSNDSVGEGYYWLEKNTTVKAGLATISGLYKILREAELRALGEAVPVQQDLTDGECYKTYAEKISGDPDADDDEHLLGLRAVIAAARKRNL